LKPSNKMRLEFLSLPENVGLARVAVAAFVAGRDLQVNELEEIKVAVSEAVTNSIIHGYKGKTDGVISVTALLYDRLLEVVVEDQGKGMSDPQQAMQPAVSTDPERVGLGFMFMKSFMDEVDVWSEPGRGTRVKMVKVLPHKKGASANSRENEA